MKTDDDSKNFNLKNYFVWMVIYLGIGAVASLLLPFKYAMAVMPIVIFLGNIIRTEIRLRKAGVGGIKGRYKPFSSSTFGQNSSNSDNLYNHIKYHCLNCGKEHSQFSCGSKAVKAGYGLSTTVNGILLVQYQSWNPLVFKAG
ncbi:MAG: hypothetical protein WBY28_05000 [Nitrososphaeraceae archaeon]